jgi:hypothetical protein
LAEIDAPLDVFPRRAAPVPVITTHTNGRGTFSVLLKLLDSRVRPGVTEAEFEQLFVQCECGCFCTRRAFENHACDEEKMAANEMIDLTEAL